MPNELASTVSDDEASRLERLSRLDDLIEEAESRLQLTLDASGATGAWDWDVPARILRGDARFAALIGIDGLELENGTASSQFFQNIHPEDRKRIRLAVAAILSGAEVFDRDFRLVRKDGSTRWVHAKGHAILDGSDEIVRFVGDLVDVTEQKRVQEQLRVAQTAGAIGTFDHAEGYGTVAVSTQFCLLLGLHPTKVLPVATVNGIVHRDDRPIIEPILPSEPHPDRNVEFRITRADTGEERWLARRGEYVRDLAGPGLRYIGVAYDITESKRIEAELRRANEMLSERVRERTEDRNRIWQNSRDLLAVIDLDGTVRDANPAWFRTLGRESAAIIGASFDDLLDDAAGREGADGRPALPRDAAGFERPMRHADGSLHTISWTNSREGDAVYAYGRDITLELEQAAALREAEAHLRQSQKMEAVGQLTGGIAHDFNNMLTGVLGSLDIIKRRLASGRLDDVDRFIQAAMTSAQRAAALTHRLLAFSRRQSLDRKATDVRELIFGMSDLLRQTLGEQVRLFFNVAAPVYAVTDANQLENAILNLAINARDAMSAGGELHITARLAAIRSGQIGSIEIEDARDFVVIDVRDTGDGMAPDVLDKAFDPFFTTKPIGQGTGLGLSMVYGFAQQSGGAVEIGSVVGQGTTVSLYLPPSFDHEASNGHHADRGVPVGAGQQIMVVEDDPAVRLLVVEVLRDLGYTPVEAADADTAITRLQTQSSFDLLITDVGLPGLNGRQLAEVAIDILPDLKVLFITGYAANAANRSEFLGPGMDMISKPFDIGRLGEKVAEMLAR